MRVIYTHFRGFSKHINWTMIGLTIVRVHQMSTVKQNYTM